ncbi:MAG: HEAT repeat domain-containing protein [Planctomycetaceae bacterium]|jgi:HEAT repeat protein|nr:HEAT repeat domain-containing protein [Planctomycetaceae bacterium]
MKHIVHLFVVSVFLTFSVFGQDPAWHRVPKDALLEKGADVIKMLLSTTDENAMLNIVKQSGAEDDILRLKMFAYKRLGMYGTKAAVPVLVEKLDIEKEGFYARYALETIPGNEIDAALCEAAKNVKRPAVLAGILTSLGVRGNPQSAATAKEFLKHEDLDVRKAAGYAYAGTAGDEAVEFFTQKSLDPALADSGFLLAEIFANKGEKEKAVKIYDALAVADIKAYQKEAALYRGILIRGLDGIDLLVAQLNSESPKFFGVGLKAGRELPAGNAVTKAMVEQLAKQSDSLRKSKLVRSIGDRKDKESKAVSLPALSELAKSGDVVVRVAAIDSLRNIGDPSVLPILIDAANQTESPEIAKAAENTLRNLPGKEIDDAIVGLLEKGNSVAKIKAIGLVEDRRIISAYPLLKKGLQDSDAGVRKAAIDALGQTAGIDDLPILLDVLDKAKSEEEAEKILNVLKSACTRLPQDAASSEVLKLFANGSTAMKINLLDLLKEIGGAKAMEIVNQYAWGDDAELKDKATAILGQWRSPQDLDLVAAACLKLAKESKENKFKVRGLRGYIRLARQFSMAEERRLQICQEVYDLANRDEDKVLIFDVFARNPSLKVLDVAVKYLDNEKFKEKASETVVAIGEKLQGKSPQTADAMKKVIEKTANNSIKERAQRVLDKQ